MSTIARDRAKIFAKFYVSRYGKEAVKQATLRIAGLGIIPSKTDRLMWRDVMAEIKTQTPDDFPALGR
ncbi:MAG: hypothetical protein RIC29_14560 [Rhodospirillaceae bacterium]